MEQKNLTAEQWQRIAEKLADYLEQGCLRQHCEDECGLPCSEPKSREMWKEDWINEAIKELGYE